MRALVSLCLAVLVGGCVGESSGRKSDARSVPVSSVPPVDCSEFEGQGSGGRLGIRIEPGPGRTVLRIEDLAPGPVRALWRTTLAGGTVEWVERASASPRRLWLLRVSSGARCVLGTYAEPEDGSVATELLEHRVAPGGAQEVVLLRNMRAGRTGITALAADATNLWIALGGENPDPWLEEGDAAKLFDDGQRLVLALKAGQHGFVFAFNGFHFTLRP